MIVNNVVNSALRVEVDEAKAGSAITQMHFARKGVITPEMEYVAIRENQQLDAGCFEGKLCVGQNHGR